MHLIFSFLLALFLPISPALANEDPSTKPEVTTYQPKILGGIEAKSSDWPWVVALLYANEGDIYEAQYCSGVLIDNTWVLTAAHCVDGKSNNDVDAAVGVFDLSNFPGNRISIKNILIHPQYNPANHQNDIALLQLHQPSNGPTIPLFSGESRENIPLSLLGKMITVIGWGMADDPDNLYYPWYFPEKLRQVNLPIVPNRYCNEIYYPPSLISTQICAGYYEGKDACNGDSGGPIVTEVDGVWVHVGLTSFGAPCDAYGGWYGVYTRTSSYVEFIKQYVPEASFWTPPTGSIVPILQLLLLTNNTN